MAKLPNDRPSIDIEVNRVEELDDAAEATDAELDELIGRVRDFAPECLDELVNEGIRISAKHEMKAEPSADKASDPPHQIGRFRIIRQLGEGGFGMVFLSHDPELDRRVAIKVPRAETLLSDAARIRFLQEGKALAKLNHPNIAAVLEIGKYGPLCFLVSDYCPGGSLAGILADLKANGDTMGPTSATQLMIRLADATAHAHEHGILHRDLKPANVVFDSDATSELLKSDAEQFGKAARIVDFGLAKLALSDHSMTQTGTTLGTWSYISPEQLRGDRDLGPASDIYSLGAILYELLTGGTPFQRGSIAATMLSIELEPPITPRRLNPTCPRDLEAICLQCLEKKPDDRYLSAKHLANDLRRHLRGENVFARRPPTMLRAWRWCRRHPVLTTFAFVILAVAVLGPVLAVQQNRLYHRAQDARQTSELIRYISDMDLAFRDYRDANLARCTELLSDHSEPSTTDDPRGFEYYFLRQRMQQCQRVPVLARLENLKSMAVSPDERWLALGSFSGIIALVELKTETETARWQAHAYDTHSMQFSIDSKRLLSANFDHQVRLWDVSTQRQLADLEGQRAAAYSPAGHQYAYAKNGSSLEFAMDNGTQSQSLPNAHQGEIATVSYSPDGRLLASAGIDGRLRIWNTHEASLEREFDAGESLWRLSWSDNGRWIAAGATKGAILIWDLEKGVLYHEFQAHDTTVSALAFSPDSNVLASGSEDNRIHLWEVDSGDHMDTLLAHEGYLVALAFTDSGKQLLSASDDGTVRRWDRSGNGFSADLLQHPDGPNSVAFSPDGKQLVTTCYDGKVRLWDPTTGELLSITEGHAGISWRAVFVPSRTEPLTLTTSGSDGQIRIWDAKLEQQLGEFPSKPDATDPLPMVVSHDGRRLAVAGSDSTLNVWDLVARKELLQIRRGGVSAIQFSPDGNSIAFVAESQSLYLVDAVSGEELDFHQTHTRSIMRLAFSPNGKLLATASHDRTVRLWDVQNRPRRLVEKRVLAGSNGVIDAVTFSPDGKILATGGGDRMIRLWDTNTGRQRGVIETNSAQVLDLAFSPDGKNLASAGADWVVKLWRAPR